MRRVEQLNSAVPKVGGDDTPYFVFLLRAHAAERAQHLGSGRLGHTQAPDDLRAQIADELQDEDDVTKKSNAAVLMQHLWSFHKKSA
jgi:hypothetical protein